MNAGGVDQACKSNAPHHFVFNSTREPKIRLIVKIQVKVMGGVANELVTRRYKPPTHA